MIKILTAALIIMGIIVGIVVSKLIYSCTDKSINTSTSLQKAQELSFIVLSDLHYFSPSLGVGETSFYYDKKTETKLTEESKFIVEAYMDNIVEESPNIVIISGDMTNNGERVNHQEVIKLLNKLETAGKRVFVVPGNHDINNPFAYKYLGINRIKTPTINPKEFEELYADFGYKESYIKDVNSLSYAVNLDSTFVLIGLDGCRYKENTETKTFSSGKLAQGTLNWLDKVLSDAKAKGRRPFVCMHHGLIEHFPGQSINPVSSEYILENSVDLINILNAYDIKIVLTGHFHANDIAKVGQNLYDIETGSAITYPHSYRKISIKNYTINITTPNIEHIKYDTKGISFTAYSKKRTLEGLENYFNNTWKKSGTPYPDSVENRLRTEFAKAVLAHYYGDEKIDVQTANYAFKLINSGDTFLQLIGIALKGIYTDTEPSDREIMLELK